jgi:hypothetical protein
MLQSMSRILWRATRTSCCSSALNSIRLHSFLLIPYLFFFLEQALQLILV